MKKRIIVKVVIAVAVVALYITCMNVVTPYLSVDAAMTQLSNFEFGYAPSAFYRAVNNYGWIVPTVLIALLFSREIKSLCAKAIKAGRSLNGDDNVGGF